jgi:hypothetical protein
MTFLCTVRNMLQNYGNLTRVKCVSSALDWQNWLVLDRVN